MGISLIVLSYNNLNFLKEFIKHLNYIEYDYNDMEIIFIDDGTLNAKETYEAELSKNIKVRNLKIKLICKKKNKGIVDSVKVGLEQANYEFIKFFSIDDYLLPQSLLVLSEALKYNGIVQGKYIVWFQEKKILQREDYSTHMKFFNWNSKKQFSYLSHSIITCNPACAYTKRALSKIFIDNCRYKTTVEWPMMLQLTRIGERITFVDKYVMVYRRHRNNISNSDFYKSKEMILEWKHVMEEYVFKNLDVIEGKDNLAKIFKKYLNLINGYFLEKRKLTTYLKAVKGKIIKHKQIIKFNGKNYEEILKVLESYIS